MVARERVGALGSYNIYLARWRPTPVVRSYVDVNPERQDIPGAENKVSVDPHIRLWHIDSWRGGEGEDRWTEGDDTFDTSTNVRPKSIGDGLVLGAFQTAAVDSADANFNDARVFGYGVNKVFAVKDNSGYRLNPNTYKFNTTTWATGAAGSLCESVTGESDGAGTAFMYSGHANNDIRRWNSAGNALWVNNAGAAGFSYKPILKSWRGIVFALDGDDLYEISQTSADTRTQRADPVGRSEEYLDDTYALNRMSLSDVGPIWLQRLDNGQTFIWEYNQPLDTASTIGKLPVDFAYPYCIYYANGFIFVGFRYAGEHGEPGEAYIYFQRGAQRGVAGPVRAPSGSTASKPILISGMIGDDLVFYYDSAIWAYNLSDGAVFQVATQTTTGTPLSTITWGKQVLICPVTNGADTAAVERFDFDLYTTETDGELVTGRFDMQYPGLDKILLDVTLVAEPLPANTQVQLSYSVEGGSWTTHADTWDTDGETSHTFTISSNSSSVVGRDFEFRIEPQTTDSSATPTIRSLTARGTSAEKHIQWEFELDIGHPEYAGLAEAPDDIIANLVALAGTNAIVQLSDPWHVDEYTAAETFDVRIREVTLPEVGTEGIEFARVVCRAVTPV